MTVHGRNAQGPLLTNRVAFYARRLRYVAECSWGEDGRGDIQRLSDHGCGAISVNQAAEQHDMLACKGSCIIFTLLRPQCRPLLTFCDRRGGWGWRGEGCEPRPFHDYFPTFCMWLPRL